MVMAAVLSSYVYLGRNFARALGVNTASEPNLEAQGRRTLAYFIQDVRMANGVLDDPILAVAPKVMPAANQVTLILPTPSGLKYITYFFNSNDTEFPFSSFTIPPRSLVRIDLASNTALTLHSKLLSPTPASDQSFYFRYYDNSGRPYDNSSPPYTTAASYLLGIKQISLSFSSQGGSVVNDTLTQVYSSSSPRLTLRNRQFLP